MSTTSLRSKSLCKPLSYVLVLKAIELAVRVTRLKVPGGQKRAGPAATSAQVTGIARGAPLKRAGVEALKRLCHAAAHDLLGSVEKRVSHTKVPVVQHMTGVDGAVGGNA